MVRRYHELNTLEKIALKTILIKDGWHHCTLGNNDAMTKNIEVLVCGNTLIKHITVHLQDFWIDED